MAKKITKTQLAKEQKAFLAVLKTMPKITSRSTDAQIDKLYDWLINEFRLEVKPVRDDFTILTRGYLFQDPKYVFYSGSAKKELGLSARGWHKDHYNYNKAEKHERTPATRRTPARNVTRTGAKRKRATSIKKYKR